MKVMDRASGFGARLASDCRGAVAVEFAFLLPVLILMIAGLVDTSRYIAQQMQVRSAAQAGVNHVLVKGWDQQAAAQAIVDATPLAVAAQPAPRLFSGCVAGTSIVETTAANCPSGELPGRYVVASAHLAFRPLIPWPGKALPATVDGTAMVRTQ